MISIINNNNFNNNEKFIIIQNNKWEIIYVLSAVNKQILLK